MKKWVLLFLALAVQGIAFVIWWRRNPRVGSDTMNRVVNPWLMRQGIPATSRGEIGLIEHVGRTSGTVRVTPVHPVRTPEGFRIIVPLGGESHWARNVLAAGHCRLQVGPTVHELDEPTLIEPTQVEDLPQTTARFMEWLGFRYLVLRQFAEHPGTLGADRAPAPEPTTIEAVSDAAAAEPVALA